ncbi:unnamed protein product [Musa acuminata subsp. burmannicoides]
MPLSPPLCLTLIPNPPESMRSKRLASHSANKASSSSSSSHSSATAADSLLPTTEDPPSTNGGPDGRSAPQTPPASKPLPEPHAAASPAATSRRSERKRKPREFGGKSSPEIRQKKVWSEHDEVELLKGALAFRSRTDALPKQPTMAAFFASIKSSVGPHLTADQVGYKLKRLKSKFVHSASAGPAAGATAHDRRIYELSTDVWAEEVKHGDAEEDESGDVAVAADAEGEEEETGGDNDRFPFIREAAAAYWKVNGRCMSGVLLEKGLKLIDPSKGTALEEKLRKQCETEMELWMKRLDMLKEISELLLEAHKSSRL